jgi:hypothetical protein
LTPSSNRCTTILFDSCNARHATLISAPVQLNVKHLRRLCRCCAISHRWYVPHAAGALPCATFALIFMHVCQSATGRYVSWLLAFWTADSTSLHRSKPTSCFYLLDLVLSHIHHFPAVYQRKIHAIVCMIDSSMHHSTKCALCQPLLVMY